MTREQGRFDENFDIQVTRATPSPETTPEPPVSESNKALTAEDLGALLCVIKAVRISTGEEIVVVLSTDDWRGIIDRHGLTITRKRP